jgi:hypothetical protein
LNEDGRPWGVQKEGKQEQEKGAGVFWGVFCSRYLARALSASLRFSPLLSRIAVSSRPPGLLFHNLIARGAGAGSLRPSFGCKCFGLDRSTNSWCLLLESAIFVEKPIEITPSPFSSFGSIVKEF